MGSNYGDLAKLDFVSWGGAMSQRQLPKDMIKSLSNSEERMYITPDREVLPERKMGQIVQRQIIVLEK